MRAGHVSIGTGRCCMERGHGWRAGYNDSPERPSLPRSSANGSRFGHDVVGPNREDVIMWCRRPIQYRASPKSACVQWDSAQAQDDDFLEATDVQAPLRWCPAVLRGNPKPHQAQLLATDTWYHLPQKPTDNTPKNEIPLEVPEHRLCALVSPVFRSLYFVWRSPRIDGEHR